MVVASVVEVEPADTVEADVAGTGTGTTVVPDELYDIDSVTGLATLLLGTTTVAVVEATPVMLAEDDGTMTLTVVEVVPEYGVGVTSVLEAVAGPTGTGMMEPEDKADCEPTELEESVGEEVERDEVESEVEREDVDVEKVVGMVDE